jgi:hypothetical protein
MLELSVQHKESKLPTYPQGFAIMLMHLSVMPYQLPHKLNVSLYLFLFNNFCKNMKLDGEIDQIKSFGS